MKKHDIITKIFLAAVIICIILQAITICYSIFFSPSADWLSQVIRAGQFLGGSGFLYLFLKLFQRIIAQRIDTGYYNTPAQEKANYISNDLNEFIKKRMDNLSEAECNRYPQVAMSACLDLLLSFLKGYDGTAIYETSIFTNQAEPEIICFKDSIGHSEASSKENRKRDPNHYKKQGYESVRYLDNPSYVVDIMQYKENPNYKNANPRQKKQIETQIFHCFNVVDPHVLVVTCNKEGLFKEDDECLKQVIRTIGLILNSELIHKEKYCCVNARYCKNHK
ncbi:MAG: hypothetical protein LBI14_07115 [Treponema sp.]|jgi:hypothetical protein|nr:hypothetical protein [Treponema sp.]